MSENFLAYLWKLRLFEQNNLTSETGEKISILSVGTENTLSGPDFFNAKIRIDDTVWAGNVEIHQKASDWLKHQHQHDKAYDNIILHLVYEADIAIKRADESVIPTLALQNRLAPNLYRNYLLLLSDTKWIPCENLIHEVDDFTWLTWIDRLLIERLQQKTAPILQSLQQNQNSWEETFYQFVARSFGAKANAIPFELLAKSLPLVVLGKHKKQLFQVEALLFGQAGLLDKTFKDEYPNKLKNEYLFLQKKFNLTPLSAHIWKFGGLRPPNFPSVRLAQFAALIHQSSSLFSKVLNTVKLKDYKDLFQVQISNYWQTHYVFDKLSKKRKKTLGQSALNSIIINTIIPIMFVYGNQRDMLQFKEKPLQLLEEIAAEKNSIIKKWNALGISTKSAYDTQALLQLKNEYCKHQKCLSCVVGNKLIRKK
ncbi:MAG: DUF2851 family protein [Chitinophagales bacterium]